jgi:hypothetical protein
MMNRPDLTQFEIGAVYRESLGEFLVRFLGTAVVPDHGDEHVAVFRFVHGGGGFLIATCESYENGQTFQRIDDEIGDDFDDL